MPKRVLVIEDNEQNMYLTSFMLERQGFEVIQAWDGRQGIQSARENRPDLILLDIQLPEMDGHTVASILKNDPDLKLTPIVAVTSYAMAGDRERILASGCNGYIEKPINPETFMTQITKFLSPQEPGVG